MLIYCQVKIIFIKRFSVLLFFFYTDTEVIYGKIIADIGKSYGKIYKEETRLKLLGTTELVTSGIAVDDMNLPITDKEFQKKMNEMGRVRLPDVPLLRGIVSRLLFLYLLLVSSFTDQPLTNDINK